MTEKPKTYHLTIVQEGAEERRTEIKNIDSDKIRIEIDDFMKKVIIAENDFIQITIIKQ